eukprot:scaffold1000_cov166-Amphora_coffeaeformis.AAC.10
MNQPDLALLVDFRSMSVVTSEQPCSCSMRWTIPGGCFPKKITLLWMSVMEFTGLSVTFYCRPNPNSRSSGP